MSFLALGSLLMDWMSPNIRFYFIYFGKILLKILDLVLTSLSSLIFGNMRVIRFEEKFELESVYIHCFSDQIYIFISESKDCFIVKKFVLINGPKKSQDRWR